MSKYSVGPIPLNKLTINIENPRFEMLGDQQEAIHVMIQDQGEKLFNLAKDIVEAGLNPCELPIVAPHETKEGYFNVLEGNRRIIVLKLLNTPELIDPEFKNYLNKFKKVGNEFKKNPITEVQCVTFNKNEDAYRWIRLKHTGENKGVGIVGWDAQQEARFEEKITGVSKIALQTLDFLKGEKSIDEDIKKRLKDVPSTSLERLLRDGNVQDTIGIIIVEGRLQTTLQKAEVIKGLTKIVKDLVDKNIKVKDIYTKENRKEYIESFSQLDLPNQKNKAEAPWELVSSKSQEETDGKKKSRPISTERHYIIPRDCILKIKEKRINKIYSELRKLNCENYVNATAVLFRVFIELSVDTFIDKFKLLKVKKKNPPTLRQKTEAVANYFEKNNVLNRAQLKPIRIAVSSQNNILSIDTFHAYVHNPHLSPIAKDLKTTWDNIQLFIETVWSHIK